MIKAILGVLGGSSWVIWAIAGAFAVGSVVGGMGVYKWFRAGEAGAMATMIEDMKKDREDAIAEAVEKALADRQRDVALVDTLEGLENHETDIGDCHADADVSRLLNADRATDLSTR